MCIPIRITGKTAKQIARDLHRLAGYIVGPLNPLTPLTFTQTGEEMGSIIYDVAIPPLQDVPEAADVVQGEIRFASDPAQEKVIVPLGTSVQSGVKLLKGVPVVASFGWLDDDGNFSKNPTTLPEFTPSDTVAPPDPVEGFGLTATGEEA
jgi:hypothetical protein